MRRNPAHLEVEEIAALVAEDFAQQADEQADDCEHAGDDPGGSENACRRAREWIGRERALDRGSRLERERVEWWPAEALPRVGSGRRL